MHVHTYAILPNCPSYMCILIAVTVSDVMQSDDAHSSIIAYYTKVNMHFEGQSWHKSYKYPVHVYSLSALQCDTIFTCITEGCTWLPSW